MTNKDQEFLKKLLSLITEDTGTTRQIHRDCDIGLVNALGQWLRSQSEDGPEPLKFGRIFASVLYNLACSIAGEAECEEHACKLSRAYAEYLHDITHAIYQKRVKK